MNTKKYYSITVDGCRIAVRKPSMMLKIARELDVSVKDIRKISPKLTQPSRLINKNY
jgi:hypothetical protein